MQWANAKSVKNLDGLTARQDILVSGSLASTYTWSLYEVTIDGNWIDDGLGGILTGLAGIFVGEDECRPANVGIHISKKSERRFVLTHQN